MRVADEGGMIGEDADFFSFEEGQVGGDAVSAGEDGICFGCCLAGFAGEEKQGCY